MQHEVFVNLRDAEHPVGCVHPVEIALGPEQLDVSLGGPVGLHPLEHGLAVMKDHGRRVHVDVAVRLDAGVVPSLFDVVIHVEDVGL